jgi:hypothetical protein
MGAGNVGELGTSDNFLYFKNIDPKTLFSRQAEKQQFQPILARKLGALVNTV